MDMEAIEIIDNTDTPFEKIVHDETEVEVRRAVSNLPDYQKEVIILRFYYDLKIREISKSSTYDMWEIEQSSRCQLVTITACRMLIIGLIDLFCVTGIFLVMNYYYQHSVIGIILYGIVPFNASCTCYLFTIMQNERGQLSYHLITCTICLAAVFSIILKQEILFQTSMLWGWGIFYLVSVIFLGKIVQKYLEHEKTIGELAWNLQ